MIDMIHAVQTPEGVDLAVCVASPVPRALAFRGRPGAPAARAARDPDHARDCARRRRFALSLFAIAVSLVTWFYPVLFEVLRHGQTPGKRMLRTRMVQRSRCNFFLVADFLPLLHLAGLVSICVDKRLETLNRSGFSETFVK